MSSSGLNPTALARLKAAFERLIDARRLPGVVAMIQRHGEVGYSVALGKQDPQRGITMGKDAVFRIHSMTKPIVSVATMMLVEQGALQLSDPVGLYLPTFTNARVGVEREGRFDLVPARRQMTIHDLLRHTAGFTYEYYAPSPVRRSYIAARLNSRDRTNAELVDALAALPLMYEPGSTWEYSRATDVLGRVLEVATGQPLGAHLSTAIFEPLAMRETGFDLPLALGPRIAEPFAHDPDTGIASALFDVRAPASLQNGGGGLLSTTADYARFLQMLLGGGTLGDVRLLGRKTLEAMTTDHVFTIPRAAEALPPDHGFGLGFAVKTRLGGGVEPGSVGSYGWSGSAGTAFFVDPQEQMFAILMTQAPGQFDEVRELFRQLVYAAIDD
ncbi:MAG: serine hydrolase domain-containing protein [Burkholderiales bacterium]